MFLNTDTFLEWIKKCLIIEIVSVAKKIYKDEKVHEKIKEIVSLFHDAHLHPEKYLEFVECYIRVKEDIYCISISTREFDEKYDDIHIRNKNPKYIDFRNKILANITGFEPNYSINSLTVANLLST